MDDCFGGKNDLLINLKTRITFSHHGPIQKTFSQCCKLTLVRLKLLLSHKKTKTFFKRTETIYQ